MNIYSYPEGDLLKIASQFKKHLKDGIPSIKKMNSGFDEGFVYKFKALFYEVHANPKEPESDNITYQYKLDLESLADQARSFFLIFRFYLQKAFPYDADLCQQYGYIEIEKMVQDYSALRTFLEETVQLINEKGSFLRAVNCPESTLDELKCLSVRITDVHEQFRKYLQKKEIKNKAYQNNLKELCRLMEIVNEAASQSLENDPESLRHLTFPPKEYIH
jgi:hypothetical protein